MKTMEAPERLEDWFDTDGCTSKRTGWPKREPPTGYVAVREGDVLRADDLWLDPFFVKARRIGDIRGGAHVGEVCDGEELWQWYPEERSSFGVIRKQTGDR